METTINDFLEWNKSYHQEREEREETNPDTLCTYGVKALDDALFCIGKNELVVLGAETGMGKSELSLFIAQNNAKQGKRVAVYYLEGGHKEAIRRMKWRDITAKYYADYKYTKTDMDFKKWMYNKTQSELLMKLEGEVYKEYTEKYRDNLYLYSTSKNFTCEKLMTSLLSFHELFTTSLDLDLIIIDHLQYFSLSKEDNEITEISKILREVKHITEYYNTPVILISHLRKRGKNAGLPTHEDFYGSGNIAKISTTSIMISPATDRDSLSQNIYPTYFRIVKSRVGVRPNYAFLVDFDLNQRKYAEDYSIYRINSFGEVGDNALSNSELPKWARKNIKENVEYRNKIKERGE